MKCLKPLGAGLPEVVVERDRHNLDAVRELLLQPLRSESGCLLIHQRRAAVGFPATRFGDTNLSQ